MAEHLMDGVVKVRLAIDYIKHGHNVGSICSVLQAVFMRGFNDWRFFPLFLITLAQL